MTPENLQILTAIVGLLQSLGTWPVLSVIALVILAPWVLLTMISHNHNKRFETVVAMYENNVHLVNDFTDLVKEFKDLSGGYRELITWTVSNVTEVKELAEKNQFCPVVRTKTNPKDVPQ